MVYSSDTPTMTSQSSMSDSSILTSHSLLVHWVLLLE